MILWFQRDITSWIVSRFIAHNFCMYDSSLTLTVCAQRTTLNKSYGSTVNERTASQIDFESEKYLKANSIPHM